MLDVPQKVDLNHSVKIDAKDVTVKFQVYDKEKNTLLGIPVGGLIAAGILAGVVMIYKARGK